MPATVTATSSAKPGLTPVPKSVEPPCSHAATSRSRSDPSRPPVMNAAVLTTFTPLARMRSSSSTDGHMGL